MLVQQGHARNTLEHCFKTVGSDWGSIKATIPSHPVRRTHARAICHSSPYIVLHPAIYTVVILRSLCDVVQHSPPLPQISDRVYLRLHTKG
jgi:hypothetical protein